MDSDAGVVPAAEGSLAVVKILLQHGADVSRAPLAVYPAALAGRCDIVKTLLAAGARLGSGIYDNMNVLHGVQDPAVLVVLIEAGVDVNVGGQGITPLMTALRCGYIKVI